jgi:ubiquinone/menaquinone biosynthesis C-methylase UbiE
VLRDSWDLCAKEWIDWVRDPGRQDTYWWFHRDRFLSLVPPAGRLTLDIGCGEGRVDRDLRQQGHRVLEVDSSLIMCQAAAHHFEDHTPVIVGDAARLPVADESADCAIAFMSLQNFDDMPGAVREIARVLADGHTLALAIANPMYAPPSPGSPDGAFVVNRPYVPPDLRDMQVGEPTTLHEKHWPLQTYTDALAQADFAIERLLEVTHPSKPIPMFLDILARRQQRVRSRPRRGPGPGSLFANTNGPRSLWRAPSG